MNYSQQTLTHLTGVYDATNTTRLEALDLQRGFIMILMAFSHCREYTGINNYSNIQSTGSPVWKGQYWLDLWQQMFVSTVAAGGFL
ncbi:hypothetical protein [Legionella spiritensis]|uniref:hypothetical protein n=1 Tax=Legionella spiritensis TaxID=452 RepID=UPI000F6C6D55|nr:hypothetical protein [Legionella spiritensis]VEG91813.1 Predicted membrane protein [Legionella spiritensis]